MKKQIETILNQYILDMIDFQSEYEHGCAERGVYPKTAYERIYKAIHNDEWMEQYLASKGIDTSNFTMWYSIFNDVRQSIEIPEV